MASVALIISASAIAHGGGLNTDGCHTNRKTGDYHCHRAPARQAPTQQATTTSSEAAAPATSASAVGRTSSAAPVCYTGPRGGTYTLTKSGKKNYGGC
ncbi:YHYH domain-containing protein [Roseateles chitinivorans]|uniref:YHYH domain-containing protein n=1 Tax=Roseateles chitinivorans TaxID=2917965 RepID=UPI003D679A36